MTKSINPNILLSISFFILLRFIDADHVFKGFIFIFTCVFLIYANQKKIKINRLFIIFIFFLFFSFIGEKKEIIEITAPLKLDNTNKERYLKILGTNKFSFIQDFYIKHANKCFMNNLNCFQNDVIEEVYISPDQFIFNINKNFSRRLSEINFTSLANSRMSFINSNKGNIDGNNIYKLDTPFYVEYRNLEKLDTICLKGFVFIEPVFEKAYGKFYKNSECINKKIKNLTGFNLPNNILEIKSYENNLYKYFDDIALIIFLLIVVINIDFKKLFRNDLKLLGPVLLSILIIFFISRYDNWFSIFNLYSFYFFGFEGGDGSKYLNFTNIMFINFYNLNFIEVVKGGEGIFHYTPGLRYFLFLNQIISGDYFYFYFYLLFFIPKIVYKFSKIQFGERVGFIVTISFLLLPILHHLGFSYYQFIRHAYRLYPEPLGYMFFLSGLTYYFSSFKHNYIKMNFLFALSVFLRPNLVLSVFFIVLVKTINERINIFHFKYIFLLFIVLLIYLFPLGHNIYFGNSLTLFTEYGSKILSFGNIDHDNPRYNILLRDYIFYLQKIFSINFLFLLLLFVPKINNYLKIILITQYITLFYFDENSRYYWIYWITGLCLTYEMIRNYGRNKWNFMKRFI